ncbi:hypothetical protein PRVXT_000324 [Proteinivorax tanatarense]|uniref:Restriction endonuclease subunit S n=1 Tax=Proteinivorax tanatarense TaxID=1260629 RepID=A0AAU7VM80_9FIRM
MKLCDFAEVKTGVVLARKKVNGNGDVAATYNLLTLNNIGDNGFIIDGSGFETFHSSDALGAHYFTEVGDVVMRLSHPHTAVYIDEKHAGLLVPSYFAIIKADACKCLPQFISWYLNSSMVKRELERSQSGSRIPSTNKNVLKSIPMQEITLEKQKWVVDLLKLHQREKNLYHRLIEEKEKEFTAITQQILAKK